MAVGTDIGNTYRGQQGTGFATVIDYNPQVDVALAGQKQQKEQLAAQEKAAKEKKLMSAYDALNKVKPDNWYVHDAQVSGMMNGLHDLGATYIARGIDPMTDPSAQDFQKLMVEITRTGEYSKQFKDRFTQVQSAYKNGEEIDNWDEVATWFHNGDITGMVNGDYGKEPKPIFKKPEVSTFKAMNEYWDKWRLNNKERIPTMDDAKVMAEEITNDPTLSQGFASTNGKFKQRYDSLPEEQKEALAARGGRLDGYQQYVAEQMYALSNPNFNTEESILKLAGDIKTSISEIERGDKTVKSRYSKHSDKDLEGYIDATLQDGAVQREVEAGKYGDKNRGIDFNRKAAIKHYLPTLKKNISTEYSEKLDEGGKAKKDEEQSLAKWRDDIKGKNGPQAQKEAIGYLNGIKAGRGGTVKSGQAGNGEVMLRTAETGLNEEGEPVKGGEGLGVEIIETDNISDEALNRYYDSAKKERGRRYGDKSPNGGGTDELYEAPKTTTTDNLY